MARENFPEKKPGDSLSAEHVNSLSRVARRVSSLFATGGVASFDGHSTVHPPPLIRLMIVSKKKDEEVDESSASVSSSSSSSSSGSESQAWECESARYEVLGRYFDEEEDAWKTDEEDGPYCLDDSEFGDSLNVGDVIQARWDVQRGMFVKFGGGASSVIRWGRAEETKSAYSEVAVSIFQNVPNSEDEEDTNEDLVAIASQSVIEGMDGLVLSLPSLATAVGLVSSFLFRPFSSCFLCTAASDWVSGGLMTVTLLGGQGPEESLVVGARGPNTEGAGMSGVIGIIFPLVGQSANWQFVPLGCEGTVGTGG